MIPFSTIMGQNTVSNWIKHENPKTPDSIFIHQKVIQSSVRFYLPNGDLDSLSEFIWINKSSILVQKWSNPSLKYIYLAYDILLQDLFKDSVRVISQNTKKLGKNKSIEPRLNQTQGQSDDLFGNSKLTKNGSLTRGITVGSNQDASLESGLRLDLSGEIADSVYLVANLTDQSTPIQPDGSTQNLREFDRVYLQLKSPNHNLEMGDIDVQFKNSEFAYINRRLQGAQYKTTSLKGKYAFLASVARGVFRSQSFQGQEGFQGPYRLVGNNGEPFIVIIAGTERVYLDGKLLTRGEEQDYIVDYSLGEIQFMPKILLNPRSRITVDFQYLNQDFSRTMIAADATSDPIWDGKWSIGASFMRETDSDNSLAQLSLGLPEIEILEKAGDDPTKAVVSGVLPFRNEEGQNRIPYQKKDTLINGENHTYYKVTTQLTGELFDVRFARLTSGLGSYQRAQSGANGVVYEYVGNGLGQYDTLRSLPRPLDHTMLTLKSDLAPGAGFRFKTEWAVSTFDENKFSSLDDADNDDFALSQHVEHKQLTDFANITSKYVFKYSGERFRYFDRPEEVDFQRKWNLNELSATEQKVHEFASNWEFTENSNLNFDAGLIQRKDMNGSRIKSRIQINEKKIPGLILENEYIKSNDKLTAIDGVWSTQKLESFYFLESDIGTFRPFVRFLYDERNQKRSQKDSLTALSYGQYAASLGLNYTKSRSFDASYEFTVRDDASILGSQLFKDSRNYIHNFQLNARKGTQISSENSFTYQQREITKRFSSRPGFSSNDAVYIKSNSRYRSLNSAIDGQFFYDVNSQRTALLQETYIEVGPELGQYVWDDLNQDGIKQIDEFYPEQTPNEGLFLKQFLPSDQLLPSINLSSRFRLAISPVKFFDKNTESLSKTLADKLDWSGSIDIRENSTTGNLSDIYLLRLTEFQNDSTTILGRIGYRSEFTFFPRNRTNSVRFELNNSKGKNKQAFGSEDQDVKSYLIELQTRFSRYLSWNNEIKLSEDERNNDVLTSRNYRINTKAFTSTFQVIQSREISYSFDAAYFSKLENAQINEVNAQVIKVGANSRIYIGDKFQASGRVQFKRVELEGESSALGNFELTEGAGAGNNWLWSLQATYQNSQWVQSSLNYDGRTVSKLPTIHTIRFIIRALF